MPAAPPNRIAGALDGSRTRAVTGNVNALAQPRFDRGAADPAQQLNHVVLHFQPTAAQQQDLDSLLKAQQTPSSAEYHRWLSPEQFGDRFGLSSSDYAKAVQWLQSEGLTVKKFARGRNWVAFSGNVGQVSHALQVSVHRYQVNGESHYANSGDPQVPEALFPVVKGFTGLNDFVPKPAVWKYVPLGSGPDYTTSAGSHYLAPEDFNTIYDITPLAQAGITGKGESIVVVGQSDVLLSDIAAFRARFNLPVNNPMFVPYAGDPGYNGAQVEGNLDLEWAGAIAPNATLYYVYGENAFDAAIFAVDLDIAPVITISYSQCEINLPVFLYQAIAQQANAQGITILAASGDAGAAGCDSQSGPAVATRGEVVNFPAVLPEVTGIGGSDFNDGGGNYWAPKNDSSLGSALSYIPETGWNETSPSFGLGATGGGFSTLFLKPDWQAGPGVPADKARDVPDLALSAAIHDGYLIVYSGSLGAVGGTSAPTPSFAGVLALLNQYQTGKGTVQPGLGNINPQLYRLAQSAPAAFHDIVAGNNLVPCEQGSPYCYSGSFGYTAGPGYDLVTGLGSVDINQLFTQWNTAADPVVVSLVVSPAKITVNSTVVMTAVVAAGSGSVIPTGTVAFSVEGIPLGSVVLAPVSGAQTAALTVPAWMLGTGTALPVSAVYAGSPAFNSGSATATIRVSVAAGASAILPQISPNPVYAGPADAQGLSWQTTVYLNELAGVPSNLTGFSIGGVAQTLSTWFPSPSIPAGGVLSASVTLRGIAYPSTQVFAFTGIDANGNTWSRQVPVSFDGPQVFQNFSVTTVPLNMRQAPPNAQRIAQSCAWSQRISLDETGGYTFQIVGMSMGNLDMTPEIPAIFGTTRLAAYGSLQGTLCWNNIIAPATDDVFVNLIDQFGNEFEDQVKVSFDPPATSPLPLTVTPATLAIQNAGQLGLGAAVLSVNPGGATQTWTASVFPANRTTAWLTLSQSSGTGPAKISVQTSGYGFEPGAYRASIVLQSSGSVPQYITVPVMYTPGASGNISITAVGNALSFQTVASPGMAMSVFGTQLANSTFLDAAQPLPNSLNGMSATINGVAAPLYYTSAGQLNIQVPFEAGSGPAVLGINNNGQIAGFQFQIAPTAPGIFTDGAGNVTPAVSLAPGGIGVLYMTGQGDVTQSLATGFAPASGTAVANLPRPMLPLSVTVGGAQAFIEFAGVPPGLIGYTQINFAVPTSVSPGVQPVVVTVNGVSSPPANITVGVSP